MLRSKATLPALQKTYDESYLTCSTAVYYEGQVSAHYPPPPPGWLFTPQAFPPHCWFTGYQFMRL